MPCEPVSTSLENALTDARQLLRFAGIELHSPRPLSAGPNRGGRAVRDHGFDVGTVQRRRPLETVEHDADGAAVSAAPTMTPSLPARFGHRAAPRALILTRAVAVPVAAHRAALVSSDPGRLQSSMWPERLAEVIERVRRPGRRKRPATTRRSRTPREPAKDFRCKIYHQGCSEGSLAITECRIIADISLWFPCFR